MTPAKVNESNMKWKNLIQFVKFCIVGVSNTVISLVIYYAVIAINTKYYLLANLVSWIGGVANSFFWNNRYVFQSQRNALKDVIVRICKTYIVYGITFLLTSALLWLEVELLGMSELYAPVANLLFSIPLNYVLNKKWAFSNR